MQQDKEIFFGQSSLSGPDTKVLRPVFTHARSLGWLGTIYIDDAASLGSTEKECWGKQETAEDHLGAGGLVLVGREKPGSHRISSNFWA